MTRCFNNMINKINNFECIIKTRLTHSINQMNQTENRFVFVVKEHTMSYTLAYITLVECWQRVSLKNTQGT